MPAIDSLAAAVIGTGLFGGLVLLSAGLVLALRESGRRMTELRATLHGSAADSAAAVARVAASLERLEARLDQRETGLATLTADLAAIRAEVEWLGGEKMIEEAARMCREGIPARRVGEELGISPDQMRVISLLRAH